MFLLSVPPPKAPSLPWGLLHSKSGSVPGFLLDRPPQGAHWVCPCPADPSTGCEPVPRGLWTPSALLGSGSCSRAFLPRTRGLPDLSRPGRRAGTPRLLLPPRWVLPGQASAQSSPDHGAEPCRMDGGLHLRPPTCSPAWQSCGSFPAMLTLLRSCVGSQCQAGPLGMGTPHHSGVGLAMP